jgi:hypothetical protein
MLELSRKGQSQRKLSGIGIKCKPLLPGRPKSLRDLNALGAPLLAPFVEAVVAAGCRAGAYTRPLFYST